MSKVLITGANRGIGLELCRQLVERGDRVIATCRQTSRDLDALDVQVIEGVNVTSQESIEGLARQLQGEEIDLLLNNAGVLVPDQFENFDEETLRFQFEVNSLGPLRMTRALSANLNRGAKVGILTSLMGSLTDNGSGSYYGYRMSKAAVNMVGVNLAHDLRDRGIAVVLLHPGMVATEMTGGRGIPPAESVAGMLTKLDQLTLAESGSFWHSDGRELPW